MYQSSRFYKVNMGVREFLKYTFHYLNSESGSAELHETVDLVQSQPVVVVACR